MKAFFPQRFSLNAAQILDFNQIAWYSAAVEDRCVSDGIRASWHGNMLQLLSRRGRHGHGQTLRQNRIGKEGRSPRHRSAAGADVTCRDRVCAFHQVVSPTPRTLLMRKFHRSAFTVASLSALAFAFGGAQSALANSWGSHGSSGGSWGSHGSSGGSHGSIGGLFLRHGSHGSSGGSHGSIGGLFPRHGSHGSSGGS